MENNVKYANLTNGETIAYLEFGNISSPPLIMTYGNFSTKESNLPFVPKLKESYRLILIDLRGYGDSSYKKVPLSIEDLADDINFFLTQLKIEKTSLIGLSLGCTAVLNFAAKYPGKTDKVVVISPVPFTECLYFTKIKVKTL